MNLPLHDLQAASSQTAVKKLHTSPKTAAAVLGDAARGYFAPLVSLCPYPELNGFS
jgi:hypothetical protein